MPDQSKPAASTQTSANAARAPHGPRICKLLARAQLDGEVREAGYVFTLAEGERGPHKTMVASNADGMAWRLASPHIPEEQGWEMPDKFTPLMRDEPLYEEIRED
jgi:hypothetical protein